QAVSTARFEFFRSVQNFSSNPSLTKHPILFCPFDYSLNLLNQKQLLIRVFLLLLLLLRFLQSSKVMKDDSSFYCCCFCFLEERKECYQKRENKYERRKAEKNSCTKINRKFSESTCSDSNVNSLDTSERSESRFPFLRTKSFLGENIGCEI